MSHLVIFCRPTSKFAFIFFLQGIYHKYFVIDIFVSLQRNAVLCFHLRVSEKYSLNEFKRHIICEKDVGLFSLIQQVIAHIPFALSNGAYPLVFFGNRCCYWTNNGYQAKTNVWEYYFEPLLNESDKNTLEPELSKHLINYPPDFKSKGYFWNSGTFVSNNFGNHKDFKAYYAAVDAGQPAAITPR